MREAATGNARLPMVEWRIGGTTSVDVDTDSDAVASLCPPLCGVRQQDLAELSSAGNGM